MGEEIKQNQDRWIHAECPKFDKEIGRGYVLVMNGHGDILYKKGKVPKELLPKKEIKMNNKPAAIKGVRSTITEQERRPKQIEVSESLGQLKYCMPIDDVVKILQKTKTKFQKQGCSDIRLDISSELVWDYEDHRSELTINASGKRLETSEETAKRIEAREKQEAIWEKQRKEEYERLKVMYEKTT